MNNTNIGDNLDLVIGKGKPQDNINTPTNTCVNYLSTFIGMEDINFLKEILSQK